MSNCSRAVNSPSKHPRISARSIPALPAKTPRSEIWMTRLSIEASTRPSTMSVSQSVISAPLSLISGPTISLLVEASPDRDGLLSSRWIGGVGLGAWTSILNPSGFTGSPPGGVRASWRRLYGDCTRGDGDGDCEISLLRKLSNTKRSSVGHRSLADKARDSIRKYLATRMPRASHVQNHSIAEQTYKDRDCRRRL